MHKSLVCVLILQFKALHNVKSAYVTLQNFTPDLQKIYTDISVITVTLCNSGAFPSVTPNNPLPIILQEEGGGHTT